MSDIHEVGSEKETKRKKFLDELSKKGFSIKVRGRRRERQRIPCGSRHPSPVWAPAAREMGEV